LSSFLPVSVDLSFPPAASAAVPAPRAVVRATAVTTARGRRDMGTSVVGDGPLPRADAGPAPRLPDRAPRGHSRWCARPPTAIVGPCRPPLPSLPLLPPLRPPSRR